MRRWAERTCGAGFMLLAGTAPLSAQAPAVPPVGIPWTGAGPPPGRVAPCDQYDPLSPAPSARIALDSRDLVHRNDGELRGFIETDSIGKVDVAVVSAAPPGAVLGVSAVPEISRLSPYFGERLKGIALEVALASSIDPVRVVLDVRQVCARHFRNTFLYY
jgi:hypothetical protein